MLSAYVPASFSMPSSHPTPILRFLKDFRSVGSCARGLLILLFLVLSLAPGFAGSSSSLNARFSNTATVSFSLPSGARVLKSNTVLVLMQGAISIGYYTDDSFSKVAHVTELGGKLYVQVAAPVLNLDTTKAESVSITLVSSLTGDRESFTAVETGPNTGIFRILTPVPTSAAAASPGDGIIQTRSDDQITATVSSGATSLTVSTNILVDPSGVVFDSTTDQPVAGATVTLLTSTGGVATVLSANGVSHAPNPVVTGLDGTFRFPGVPPGTYIVKVVPPAPYTAPSVKNLAQLPADRQIDPNGSFGRTFTLGSTGAVTFDYPVDRQLPTGGLFIEKLASSSVASAGDFIDYTVKVRNSTSTDLLGVKVIDRLPLGFSFVKNSFRVTGSNGGISKVKGGNESDEGTVEIPIGALAKNSQVTLVYRTKVGAGATRGDGTNRAQALSALPAMASNIARVRIDMQDGAFNSKGVLIGKVFLDKNHNRVQDPGEDGIPGVRLFMEDGSYVVTDSEGKYSLAGVTAQTHIVKLDRTTLPPHAHLEIIDNRNAGDPGSVMVGMNHAEMQKVNFAVLATPELEEYVAKIRDAAEKSEKGEIDSRLKAVLNRPSQPNVNTTDVRGLPSSGVIVPGTSVLPTQQDRTLSGGSLILGGSREAARVPVATPAPAATPKPAPAPAPAAVPAVITGPTVAWTGDSQPSGVPLAAPTPEAIAATVPLDGAGPTLTVSAPTLSVGTPAPAPPKEQGTGINRPLPAEGVEFSDLNDGDTLPMAQTNIHIRGNGALALRVNGEEVPPFRIGSRSEDKGTGMQDQQFIGVPLHAGSNILEVTKKDPFGNVRGTKKITVIAPDRLGEIRLLIPKECVANGRTPVKIGVELVDSKGVRVTARTELTLEANLSQWLEKDVNEKVPGVQTFIEGGKAEFLLAAPVEPGESHIRVSSGALRSEGVVSFLPDLRPMLAAGIIEGRINVSHLSSNALVPSSHDDGFQQELSSLASSRDVNAGGRVAFYLKGKIQGNYLLTAAYDSSKRTNQILFRDIQPDTFYPVYGDSSTRGFDAQSSGRLYVRIDNKRSYLLYGDFTTQSSAGSDVHQLGAYSRSLNGVREHFENTRVSANAWGAYTSDRQVVEEVRANGTSGPYAFRASNGLTNSERVEIVTRDRNNPGLIIKDDSLARFTDYEFEPFTGHLLFKAPVPSVDESLNPVFVRITYEVNQGGQKFWTYGADGQVKVTNHLEIGAAFAREENPLDKYGIYSADAVLALNPHSYLIGEVARSEDELLGSGNAWRLELRHTDDRLTARVFYGVADPNFKNLNAQLSAGHTEGGAQIQYQLSQKTKAQIQIIDSESKGSGTNRGVLAGVEQTFGKGVKFEVDGRYSKQTAGDGSGVNLLSPYGNTLNLTPITAPVTTAVAPALAAGQPAETTSVRAKLTLPIPWTEGAGHIYGEYEQDVADAERRMLAIGGEYQTDAHTKVYARHEIISSLQGPFDLNNTQQQHTTVVGVQSEYMKGGNFFNEYRMGGVNSTGANNSGLVSAINPREAELATGLRNSFTLIPGLKLNTSFERVSPLVIGRTRMVGTDRDQVAAAGRNGQTIQSDKATAITLGLDYTGSERWKASTRWELRTSTAVDSLLNTNGLAFKINDDWTALSRTILYVAHNKDEAGGNTNTSGIEGTARHQLEGRIQIGAAWRPTATDKWNALAKYEFRDERGVASGTGFGGDATANVTGVGSSASSNDQLDVPNANRLLSILSVDLNYQPTARVQANVHYAGKWVTSEFNDLKSSSSAHLLGLHSTFDVTDKWDVGFNGSALVDGSFQSAQLALGAEIGYTLSTNMVVGVGYNFLGYYDRDLSDEQYTTKGFYLNLRMKFDEGLFHRRKED